MNLKKLNEYQLKSILEINSLEKEFFMAKIKEKISLLEFLKDRDYSDNDEKIIALMIHDSDLTFDESDTLISNRTWLVLTDEEANEAAENSAKERMDDLLYNIDKSIIHYFDEKRFIEDNSQDRGSCLNYMDGEEYNEEVNGTIYYIYNQG